MTQADTSQGSTGATPLMGRVAIVTGGSTGVGRGIAIALAGSGAATVVGYHRDADGAADTCATIGAAGGRAVACGADISTENGAASLVRRRWTRGGGST